MSTEDDRQNDYLWDSAAPPDPAIESVERRLAPLRFEAVRRPLTVPASTAARTRRFLALAAAITLVAGTWALWTWRWSWPAGAPWPVTIQAASATSPPTASRLQLDRRFELGADASARVEIARIGTMSVAPGTALVLSETRSGRHRVQLDRGAVSVRVWAPPGRFALQTPAGIVIDLGCVFDLSVDARRAAHLHVITGWVQLANGWGEALVPAGASSDMAVASAPGVPVYQDAAPAFVAGVRALESAPDEAAQVRATDATVSDARPRDVITLLLLATRVPAPVRRPL